MVNVKQVGKNKLYYQGEWSDEIFAKCMGVVGSRRMTSYGRRVVEKIVLQLVAGGWTIVSGMMYGVDQAAHEVCLDCGGKTIGVLGWGIEYNAGDREQDLQRKIVESGGLLVSLWKDQMGTNWTFPARNQVVADICHELIVVEAAAKSGALLTAGMMIKRKKPVWAVPGPLTSSVSAGTNGLISTGKAKMWTGDSDNTQISNFKSQNPILELIRDEGLEADEIARKLGQPISEVGAQLSLLSLSGEVEEREGKFFRT